MTTLQHLKNRHCDVERYTVYTDEQQNIVTFILFNPSGQLVGYQQYRPDGGKERHNDPKSGRYYTYRTKTDHGERRDTTAISVFGLETINYRKEIIVFVEGIFDATRLHQAGIPTIAVLSNDPKFLANWIMMMFNNRIKIAVSDGDAAGTKLEKYCDITFRCPDGEDVGSLSDDEFNQLVRKIDDTYK